MKIYFFKKENKISCRESGKKSNCYIIQFLFEEKVNRNMEQTLFKTSIGNTQNHQNQVIELEEKKMSFPLLLTIFFSFILFRKRDLQEIRYKFVINRTMVIINISVSLFTRTIEPNQILEKNFFRFLDPRERLEDFIDNKKIMN